MDEFGDETEEELDSVGIEISRHNWLIVNTQVDPNKLEEAKSIGRPYDRKLTPDEMKILFEQYLEYCYVHDDPVTITGACLKLGIYGWRKLYQIEKEPEYTQIVKRIKSVVANAYEKKLTRGNASGAMLALSNMDIENRFVSYKSGINYSDGGDRMEPPSIDLSKLDDEELQTLERLLEKGAGSSATSSS